MGKDFNPEEFSVDDILMENRAGHGRESGRKWSMEDIDALLADEPSSLLEDVPLEHTGDSLFRTGEELPAVNKMQEQFPANPTASMWRM